MLNVLKVTWIWKLVTISKCVECWVGRLSVAEEMQHERDGESAENFAQPRHGGFVILVRPHKHEVMHSGSAYSEALRH